MDRAIAQAANRIEPSGAGPYAARAPLRRLSAFRSFAVRDLLALAGLCAAWSLDARLRGAGGEPVALAYGVGVLAGLWTTLVAFLCHEWGHLAGTVLAGGTAHAPRSLLSPFLFYFDVARSDRRAFLWMSYGGYLASALSLAALVALVPHEALSGRVALGTAALGVLVTFALEVPTTIRVARGAALPRGGVFADESGHRAVNPPSAR